MTNGDECRAPERVEAAFDATGIVLDRCEHCRKVKDRKYRRAFNPELVCQCARASSPVEEES